VLDDRIRAGEHQAAVTILESHEVWRLAASAADLDDLAHPLRLAHDAAVYVKPVPHDCLHLPTSLGPCRLAARRLRQNQTIQI
jgi:hypothetical protein